MQDAILQIELPTRIIKRESIDGNSPNGSWSSSSDGQTDHGSPDPWRPFKPQTSTRQTVVASKTMNQAIRKIMLEQAMTVNSIRGDNWNSSTALAMRTARHSMPPAKPIGSYLDALRSLPMASTRLNQELVRTRKSAVTSHAFPQHPNTRPVSHD